MMISNFYIMMNYMFSLILFVNYNNPIFFWVLMEFNLVSFVLILYFNKDLNTKQDSLNYLIFYFLIQSSASILFLSNFSLVDWSSIFNCDVMFICSLVFKIGLFPVFFWVFSMSEALIILPLILLLTTQKIPLFLGLFSCDSSFLLTLLLSSFISGSLMLFFSFNFMFLLICSSISYSFMFFLLYTTNSVVFFSLFFFYSLFLSLLLFYYSTNLLEENSCSWTLSLSYIFMLGLPPLGLFFYKFVFSSILVMLMGSMELLVFWSFSFIALMGYVKFFHSSFFNSTCLFQKKSHSYNSMTLFFLTLAFFFLFTF